jgi:very-short-patch-repair endonuclease
MESDKKKVARMFRAIKKKSLNINSPFKKKKYIENQAKKMSKKMTWPEKEFEKILKQLSIKYEKQKIVYDKVYDFFVPSHNMLIEIDGDYWHGKGLTYENKTPTQKKCKRNDEYKTIMAKGLGYAIERVWESDLKDKYDFIKNKFERSFTK